MRKSRATDHHGSEFAHFRMDAKCPFHWSVSLCWPVQRPGERKASFIEGHTNKDEYSVGSLIQINLRRWPPSRSLKFRKLGPTCHLQSYQFAEREHHFRRSSSPGRRRWALRSDGAAMAEGAEYRMSLPQGDP